MTKLSTFVCFGEVLWDVLPTGKQAGGAPMNVALHLRNLGQQAQLISRVGTDDLGRELLDFLHDHGMPTSYVQIGQSHLTGVAKANVSDANEVTYKIVQPVAWDYIQPDDAQTELVRQSEVFIYGSLAARSPQTCETLIGLLDVAAQSGTQTVFDVNLRAPHYDRPTVEALLSRARMVKLNEHELIELTDWYGYEPDLKMAMQQLYSRYHLDTLCVTLGPDGAALLDRSGYVRQMGFPVQVADTIGSGDSFLAALLASLRAGRPTRQALELACATGAYVATRHGATPSFSEDTIQAFLAADRSLAPAIP